MHHRQRGYAWAGVSLSKYHKMAVVDLGGHVHQVEREDMRDVGLFHRVTELQILASTGTIGIRMQEGQHESCGKSQNVPFVWARGIGGGFREDGRI